MNDINDTLRVLKQKYKRNDFEEEYNLYSVEESFKKEESEIVEELVDVISNMETGETIKLKFSDGSSVSFLKSSDEYKGIFKIVENNVSYSSPLFIENIKDYLKNATNEERQYNKLSYCVYK